MPPFRSAWDRFWEKVDTSGPCWNWTASLDRKGYGQFAVKHGKMGRAHRVAYELLVGPVPDGLVLDHLCKNTVCVNPDHLDAVTQGVNVRRSAAGRHQGNVRETCRKGLHSLAIDGHYRANGSRYCRPCASAQAMVRYHRKVAVSD